MPVEAFCLASGPSLTMIPDDLEKVRAWRNEKEDRIVIVTNTAFRYALWADFLYGMDSKWWKAKPDTGGYASHAEEAKATFKGELMTCSQAYRVHKITFVPRLYKWSSYGNSGTGAINLARHKGARLIYLLGYDCQRTNGKVHCHGDHPKVLSNATSMRSWPDQHKRLESIIGKKGIKVFNCTRCTALKVWPRMTLEEALAKTAQAA